MFEFAFCFKDDKLENVCISKELILYLYDIHVHTNMLE